MQKKKKKKKKTEKNGREPSILSAVAGVTVNDKMVQIQMLCRMSIAAVCAYLTDANMGFVRETGCYLQCAEIDTKSEEHMSRHVTISSDHQAENLRRKLVYIFAARQLCCAAMQEDSFLAKAPLSMEGRERKEPFCNESKAISV